MHPIIWWLIGLLGSAAHVFLKVKDEDLGAVWAYAVAHSKNTAFSVLAYTIIFLWWLLGGPGLEKLGVQAGQLNVMVIAIAATSDTLVPHFLNMVQAIFEKN